jgi:hypothetical protein
VTWRRGKGSGQKGFNIELELRELSTPVKQIMIFRSSGEQKTVRLLIIKLHPSVKVGFWCKIRKNLVFRYKELEGLKTTRKVWPAINPKFKFYIAWKALSNAHNDAIFGFE